MMDKREIDHEDMERMQLPPELWEVTLEKVPESVQQVVARYLSRAPQMVSACAGLLLMGPPGVGKSAIAALIAKEVRAHRMPVFWISVSDLRESIRKRLMFDEEQTMMDRARAVPLLVLDDLDPADASDRLLGARDLERLVLQRGGWKRPTIITTRIPFADIDADFGTFAEAVKGRMVPLLVEGPNQCNTGDRALKDLVMGARR